MVRARAWLDDHREEYVADLLAWVRVPSVADATLAAPGAPFGPAVAEVIDLVERRARELGFATHPHDGFALSVTSGDGEEEIGLVSHLDVVPAGEGWTHEPYEPFERDGVVVGRGSADNKGAALIDLYLLRAFRDLEIPLRHSLRIIYGGAEEVGMPDIVHYVEHAPVPRQSLITDGPFPVNHAQKGGLNISLHVPTGPVLAHLRAGVAENAVPATAELTLPGVPTSEVEEARAGIREEWRDLVAVTTTPDGGAHVHARGRSGHAAFPDRTLNAILVLAEVLVRVPSLDAADLAAARALATTLATPYGDGSGLATSDDVTGPLTQNGGLVEPVDGGVTLALDIRYPVASDGGDLTARLAALAAGWGGHVVAVRDAPPFHVPEDDALVRLLQGTFNQVLDVDETPFAMGGGTHARHLPRSITFGPGFGRNPDLVAQLGLPARPSFVSEHAGPHGPDEYASIDGLFRAFEVYVVALVRLDAFLADGGSERG
ncbi:peptidase M20 [Serinibacter arcticus]|uniref:Peptidase M20 n=1 Tax=Serinibacter arcticus TaxID=1655435 RepID=A0A2U1ZZS9_9MICO|nr:peptidase M20 [Serinibacter arcticus]